MRAVTVAELRALADECGPQREWWQPIDQDPDHHDYLLIAALGPDAARLLADAMEFLGDEAGYAEHHPDCALYLPQKECDCGIEDREAMLVRFASLGEDTP